MDFKKILSLAHSLGKLPITQDPLHLKCVAQKCRHDLVGPEGLEPNVLAMGFTQPRTTPPPPQ